MTRFLQTEVTDMTEFIMCIVQYVVIALFLVGVAGAGAFIGIKMRKSSDAKNAAAATEE
ncbi:MAG: hypothetical protein IJ958_05140 [Agathobacter sp.]|nr:hypothetical protein [Agathobacter sp.]